MKAILFASASVIWVFISIVFLREPRVSGLLAERRIGLFGA